MKTNTTLRLTRAQYRTFSEATKEAGVALNVSTFKKLGNCWGTYSPWALLVCRDATEDEPQWHERALINLACSINSEQLRSNGPKRPELDWGALEDEEIYPFVVWHEIGHRVHNIDPIGTWTMRDLDLRDRCYRRVNVINEVLADRYAWDKIRPGETIPLGEHGKRMADQVAEWTELLTQHCPMLPPVRRPLLPGQYNDVPEYMLDGPERAAFIGRRVSKALIRRTAATREAYRMGGSNRPY